MINALPVLPLSGLAAIQARCAPAQDRHVLPKSPITSHSRLIRVSCHWCLRLWDWAGPELTVADA